LPYKELVIHDLFTKDRHLPARGLVVRTSTSANLASIRSPSQTRSL